jgi:hypothetical protein
MKALIVLALFTDIEAFHWAVITHYAGVNKAFASFVGVFGQEVLFFGVVNCLDVHENLDLIVREFVRHISDSICVRR